MKRATFSVRVLGSWRHSALARLALRGKCPHSLGASASVFVKW